MKSYSSLPLILFLLLACWSTLYAQSAKHSPHVVDTAGKVYEISGSGTVGVHKNQHWEYPTMREEITSLIERNRTLAVEVARLKNKIILLEERFDSLVTEKKLRDTTYHLTNQ